MIQEMVSDVGEQRSEVERRRKKYEIRSKQYLSYHSPKHSGINCDLFGEQAGRLRYARERGYCTAGGPPAPANRIGKALLLDFISE